MNASLSSAEVAHDGFLRFQNPVHHALVWVGLGILYFFAARLGFSLAFAHENVSPIWPPTGIALAGVLLLGYRVWPAIALAAFAANYSTGLSVASAGGIALGNTLEALIGALLLLRFAGGRTSLNRAADVFKFVLLACVLSTMVSSTIGTISLHWGGFTNGISLQYLCWTWWLGDAAGALIVAPPILTWISRTGLRWSLPQAIEAFLILILILIVGEIVFVLGPWFPVRIERVFLVIPLIVLAAFRFQQRGATAAIFVFSALAISSTRHGFGPFVSDNLNESLLSLQMFMGVSAVMGLVLAAVIKERSETELALVRSEEKYRTLAEHLPSVTSMYIAEFGPSWRTLYISPQIEPMLGFTPEEWIADPELWPRQMHPDDRERVLAEEEVSRRSGRSFHSEYRLFRKDGGVIWVSDEGETLRDQPHLYQGIVLDITERKRGEEDSLESAARFQRVLASVSDHIWSAEFDRQGKWTYHYFSPVVEKITGRPPEFYAESPKKWLSTVYPEDKFRLVQAFERLQSGLSAHEEEEYRIVLPDGVVRWIRDSATVTQLEQDRFRIDGVVSDITERKRSELVQSALYRIAEKTTSVRDIQEFYSAIHEIVGELMYAKNFYIALYEPSTDMVAFPYFVDEIDASAPPRKTRKGLTDYVIRTGDSLLVSPEKFNQMLEEGLLEPIGAESIDWLGVPLKSGERTFGALAVQSYTEKVRFGEKEKDLLTFVSHHIATALHRKHMDLVERQNEERIRLFVKHTPAAIAMFDREMRYIMTSQRWKDDCRLGNENLIGRSHYEVFPEIPDQWKEIHVRCLAGAVERCEEDPFPRADGTLDWVRWEIHPWHDVTGEIGGILMMTEVITERKRAEEALRESEEKYRQFFDEDLTGDFISTPDGRILACNPTFARIFGFTSVEEALNCTAASLYPDAEARTRFLELLRDKKKLEYYELELRRRDGEKVYLIENIIGIFNESGELIQIRGYIFDNTQNKKLEEQLRDAQKLKAIGQLAGGVAHDFNNILMAITAYCELLEMKLGSGHALQRDVLEIQKAAQQAAALTRQLLAFSRKQVLELKVLNINHILADMQNMLRRMIRENIELAIEFGDHLGAVRADVGQLEQVILNLAVNAQDAMSQGGKMIIATGNIELDDEFTRLHVGAAAGRHVMLLVKDTGVGMDKATISRIFEPFFTTKEKGKGTGLGLSSVYGSVKQSGGYISVESEPGAGTTFKIYLPRVDEEEEVLVSRERVSRFLPGGKTVLLVDDNESVLNSIAALLEMQGYTVLKASAGMEALEIAQKFEKSIELLVTDMVMPVMSGSELAKRLLMQRPEVKVLFISGYTEDAVGLRDMPGVSTFFLAKPVSMEKMAHTIRDLLKS